MITARRRRRPPCLLSIAEATLTLASRHARENLPTEVGGVLVGWREGRDVIVVQDFLLVPQTNTVSNRYDREHDAADELLQQHLTQAADPRLGYVGEWHSHPAPLPPSSMDLKTIGGIASDLHAPVALVVLMAHRDGRSIEPTGHVAERARGRARLREAHIGTH